MSPQPLVVGLVASLLLMTSPSKADKDCDKAERKALEHLEHHLANCDGIRPCELDMRERCFEQLTRHGCNARLCEPPPGAGAGPDEDGCFFEDAARVTNVTNAVLDDLLDPTTSPDINEIWQDDVAPLLDPLPAEATCGDDALYVGSVNIGSPDCLCPPFFDTCDKVTLHMCIKQVTGLKNLHFDDLAVADITTQDLSTGSSRGPEASRITHHPSAADGTSWDDTEFAVVLPAKGPGSALTIDTGSVRTFCGALDDPCPPQQVQRSGDDDYTVEYSLNGETWEKWFDVPARCPACVSLYTDQFFLPSVQARYARIYALRTTGTEEHYSVSSLAFLSETDEPGVFMLGDFPARGPQPLLTSEPFPIVDGSTAWNDPLATVLPTDGTTGAVTIDLGRRRTLYTDGKDNPGLIVDASGNDDYRLDYSLDGINWTHWVDLPQRCGCTKLEVFTATPANISARFVRIYHGDGTAGDGKYSVSRVILGIKESPTAPLTTVSNAREWGPESLATNGEYALPEGYKPWDDPQYSVLLGRSGDGVLVDLGKAAGRGIERVQLQSHWKDAYGVEISEDGYAWKNMVTFGQPQDVQKGLVTRNSGSVPLVDPDRGGPNVNLPYIGRYVRVIPRSGTGDYAVSELQIFNNTIVQGCPFDADANAGLDDDDPTVECAYSGQFSGHASFPTGKVTTTLAELRVVSHCSDPILGTSTLQNYPAIAGDGWATCEVSEPAGFALADLCGLSCNPKQTEEAFAALTYMQVSQLDLGVKSYDCDFNPPLGVVGGEIEEAIRKAVEKSAKDTMISTLTPVLQDALNDVIKGLHLPVPAQICE